mgnify:CR=1 FL=1
MNKFGEATPISMLGLLEDAAADHCQDIDYGLYKLLAQDIGWVLISGYMQIDRYPKYKEKIKIRTWLSKYKSIRGFRENVIYDEQEKVIGYAKGQWLFFDIKNRKPARIYPEIESRWDFFPEQCIEHDILQRIEPLESAENHSQFPVYGYDVDSNEHVNNLRYLQWLLETVPNDYTDKYFLHTIDGRFMAEAEFGHNVMSLTKPLEKDNCFIHTINDISANKSCATAITNWRKR